jgi:hypothetical protein
MLGSASGPTSLIGVQASARIEAVEVPLYPQSLHRCGPDRHPKSPTVCLRSRFFFDFARGGPDNRVAMPMTRAWYSHLYKVADWSSMDRIQLPPSTPILLTGNSDGHDGDLEYVMVWAPVDTKLELGWIWTGHIAHDSYTLTVQLREKYPKIDLNYNCIMSTGVDSTRIT